VRSHTEPRQTIVPGGLSAKPETAGNNKLHSLIENRNIVKYKTVMSLDTTIPRYMRDRFTKFACPRFSN
jgi:hypothetical protein